MKSIETVSMSALFLLGAFFSFTFESLLNLLFVFPGTRASLILPIVQVQLGDDLVVLIRKRLGRSGLIVVGVHSGLLQLLLVDKESLVLSILVLDLAELSQTDVAADDEGAKRHKRFEEL